MWRRGADPDGYVANFVETEQIVQMNGFTSSFVQVKSLLFCSLGIKCNIWSPLRSLLFLEKYQAQIYMVLNAKGKDY